MAGNNSIQFLRGTEAQRATHTERSLVGQPIFETDTNRLYVGDGTTSIKDLVPVNSSLIPTILTVVKTGEEWNAQNPVLLPGQFGYDTTNKITKIGDGTTNWFDLDTFVTKPKPTFANSDWATIAEVSENGQAQSYFSVGDEKTIQLTTGEQITLVILGFNHDDLSDGSGKAGMSIGMKNLLDTTYRMDDVAVSDNGWDKSEMRTSTMAMLLSQLPYDLQIAIKQVNKKSMSGKGTANIATSADKLWLFSLVEIDGTGSSGYNREGEQYEYWKTVKDGDNSANRIKYLSNGGGSASSWWLRSRYFSYTLHFCIFDSTGSFISDGPKEENGVCFGFCV